MDLGNIAGIVSQFKNSLSLKNRFSRDVLWNVGAYAIMGISGLLINASIMALRGAESLGVFNQVFAFYIIVSQLAVGGMQFSALKHCSYVQDNSSECSLITSSALILVAAFSFIICLLLFLLRNLIGEILDSSDVAYGIGLAVFGLFFYSLNKVLMMTLNGMRHMRTFAVFQTFRYVLIPVALFVIITMNVSNKCLPLSLTIADFAVFVVLMVYINIWVFKMRFYPSPALNPWFPCHISFGLRGFLSGFLIEMNTRTDILLLGYYMSDAKVGIYSFAATFAEGFAQLTAIIRQNVDPILGKCFAEKAYNKIENISKRIKKVFYPIIFCIAIGLVAVFPVILYLVSSNGDNMQCWIVFIILVLGFALTSGYQAFIAIFLQGGRPGMFSILIAITVLINIILNMCFIPLWGLYGSAIATVMAYILQVFAIIVLSRKLFNIRL